MAWHSVYFTRKEFVCPCGCGVDVVDAELLFVLDRVRSHFCVPVYITSAARCEKHNAAVKGHPHSYHLFGKAADFRVSVFAPNRVINCLESLYPDRYGIGEYINHVHLDIRPIRARWEKL